ncbi:Uncharacterised protein [Mycobacterium tuberculosis]|nr:Uncharacterised protein [Mycobacterium tuberculosis]
MPTAPASSNTVGIEYGANPVALILLFQAAERESLFLFIFSMDSGVPYSFQLASGRPVGCGIEIMTYLPFTCGNHALNASESLKSANGMTSASIAFPLVVGLHANCVPANDFWRG